VNLLQQTHRNHWYQLTNL